MKRDTHQVFHRQPKDKPDYAYVFNTKTQNGTASTPRKMDLFSFNEIIKYV